MCVKINAESDDDKSFKRLQACTCNFQMSCLYQIRLGIPNITSTYDRFHVHVLVKALNTNILKPCMTCIVIRPEINPLMISNTSKQKT